MDRRVVNAPPDVEPPLPRRGWWTAAIFLCVGAQVGTTIALPDQIWSMPAGMAGLAALCAFVTAAATPRARGSIGVWRWRLVTLGFTIWAISWAATAVTRSLIDYEDEFLHLFHIPRQIVFLIVLLPTVEEDRGWLLRGLDLGQTLLLALAIALLAWPSAAAASSTITGYLNSGFLFSGLVAITSLLTQRGHVRRLLTGLSILFLIYAATSFGAGWIFQRYALDRNSPWWVYGDAAYIIYPLFLLWAGRPPPAMPGQAHRRTSRHLPPLLLTAVLLMMAIEVGHRSTLGGAIVGIGGLLLYAIRTTLLNDRYLAERDRLIALEAKRAHALIDIVHEIRSPLGSVVLNASLLARSEGLPQPQRNWVDQIHKGGTRVTTLLNDILDLERLDAGLVDADLTGCNPRTIAADALAVVAGQARTFGVILTPPVLDSDHRIIADRDKLERVLVNLATNAIRFTPAGGRVAITIETLDPLRTAITVADTGSGISAAGQAVLFERFGHVGTPVNGIRGSGLGLSICRGLMTAMNGTLDITSEPGQGTRAVVILPSATTPRRLSREGSARQPQVIPPAPASPEHYPPPPALRR